MSANASFAGSVSTADTVSASNATAFKQTGESLATSSEAHVIASDVVKRFPGSIKNSDVVAIDGVSFQLSRRTFTSIVGPSGCGKTTLLRIIAGLESLTTGELRVAHADVSRPINTMVFQEQSIFPWMTVRQNIEYGLQVLGHGRTARKQESDFWLSKVGLIGFENSYPATLSGGMKQRTSLARSLATKPELLLMDEPFAAVDEQTRLTLQNALLKIWDETRTTVIFITHSIEEALTLSDEILIMGARPGRIIDRISIPFERPRDAIELRTNPLFGELMMRIWNKLSHAL